MGAIWALLRRTPEIPPCLPVPHPPLGPGGFPPADRTDEE